MSNRDKVITAVSVSLAVPTLAAIVLPFGLVVPLSLVVPFIALSHLEGLNRSALA
jgi:hypothetical protein